MRTLPQVTLIGIDCVDVERLLHVAEICQRSIQFGDVRMLTSIPHDHPSIVPIAPITSREAYSSFMIKGINSYVDTPEHKRISHRGHREHRVIEPKLGVHCVLCGSNDVRFAIGTERISISSAICLKMCSIPSPNGHGRATRFGPCY